MKRSDYLKMLLKNLTEGNISQEAYDHGVANADVFSEPEEEGEEE